MPKLLPILALLLAGCTEIVIPNPVETPNLHVYNSAWQIVAEATVAARALDSAMTLEEYVANYNATHTDDQLFLVEGDPVPETEAPDATAFIVKSDTLDVVFEATVPRVDLVENRDAWRRSVEVMSDPITGERIDATLYVDNVPPEPIAPPQPPAPKLWTGLVDLTTQTGYYMEEAATQAEANYRYNILVTQAELEERPDALVAPGDDWMAYIGETEWTP
jgi:hypothetical protein